MGNRRKNAVPFTEQDVGEALRAKDFLSVQLVVGADFGNRPWVLLSSMPDLDQEISALNKLYGIGVKIRLLPVLVFHEGTGGPVIPFRRLSSYQGALEFDFASIEDITGIIKKVADGMAAAAAPDPATAVETPSTAETDEPGGNPSAPLPDVMSVEQLPPTPEGETSNHVESAAEMLKARTATLDAMKAGLASATRLGLTEKDVRNAVESLAQHQRSGAKLLLPTAGGGTTEIELPPLEALRSVRVPQEVQKRQYAGLVSGYDDANDLLFLDGRLAISGYSKLWSTRPSLGQNLIVTGVPVRDIVLRTISVSSVLGEQLVLPDPAAEGGPDNN